MEKILFNLQYFADVTPINKTSDTAFEPTMKEYWDTLLLENAKYNMVFDQFGVKQPMKGNKCEWRKFNTFDAAMTPLTEGVIPSGKTFGMTNVEASTTQHGDYVSVSDRLEAESFDDVIFGATEEMGDASGKTFDTLTRNALLLAQSKMFCPNGETVINDKANLTNDCILTPAMVHKAATWLKKNKAPKINGSYVALIHPSVAHDLTESQEWKEFHKYCRPEEMYKGEIGELYGVRFVESENCAVEKGETGSAKYCTIFLGAKAYGILDPDGEGMEMIIHGKDEIGGPLNQFSTIGYKFCHGAKILYHDRINLVWSGSSFGDEDVAN